MEEIIDWSRLSIYQFKPVELQYWQDVRPRGVGNHRLGDITYEAPDIYDVTYEQNNEKETNDLAEYITAVCVALGVPEKWPQSVVGYKNPRKGFDYMSGDDFRAEYRSDIRAIGAFMVDAALSAVPIEEQDDTSTEGASLVLQANDGRLVLK